MYTRILRACLSTLLVAAGTSLWSPAQADPLPADYAGSTDNSIIGMDLGLFGFNLAGLDVAHTETDVDSTGTPRSFAESANIGAAVAGLSVPIAAVSQSAPPDHATPTTGGLTQVDVPGLLDTGVITGSAQARWLGDASCAPSGTALSSSAVQMAGLTVGNAVVEVAQLGAASTSGTTSLVANGGAGDDRSVVSSSTGNISSLTLLNDAIRVNIGGAPTLVATASGDPGGASVVYSPPSISVTALGNTTTLTPGASISISIPFVGSVTITMGVPTISTTADGRNASGDVSLLSIGVTLLGGLGTASLDILPLHAEAHAPPGGVQCGLLDAPVITGPAEGSTTEDTTPTITGTGVPGATVTVREGSTVLGTAVVAGDGTWSLTPVTPLPLGSHEIVATQTLGSATSGPSNSPTFEIVDATAPPAPVITTPADGATISDSTPTVSGTAEPGSTVEVVVDGSVLGTVVAAPDGSWSLPVTTPLTDGEHTVSATATDASGNESAADSNTFTVDTAAAAPVITTPADESSTSDTTPTITGTAEGGAEVEVRIDGVLIGTTTAAGDGSWSLPVTTPLTEGDHTVTAVQTDVAGNVSPAASNDFTVDTTDPDAPVITGPAHLSTIGDDTPTVTGTAEPGATVVVEIDGTVVGTVVADENGLWSIETTTPLGDGPHQVSATQTDLAGNESATAQNTFFVDTAAAPPVIEEPVSGSVTDDSTPEITGTGEIGATVTVTTSDGTVLGTAIVAGDGTWTLVPATPLPDGTYTITAFQTDAVGNESPSSSPVIFTVDTTIDAPVITAPADGSLTNDSTPTVEGTAEPGSTVTVTIDGTEVGTAVADPVTGEWTLTLADPLTDGDHTVEAVATDPAGNVSAPAANDFTVDTTAPAAPAIVTPADGSVTDDDTPLVTGTAEPGSTVTVRIDGVVIGTVVADAEGDWQVLAPALADGPHVASATATDVAGNTSPAASHDFVVDTVAPAAPSILTPVDGSTTDDPQPTVTGTAEPGATVEVTVDGAVVGTVVADDLGNWALPLPDALDDGPHTIEATQTDEAGNTSPPATSDFTVDTSAPAAPVVTSPSDGSTIDDPTPIIRGTAEPGSTVTVTVDGVELGTAVAGPLGDWSFPVTEPLADGVHTVTATATDEAGNTSPASAPVEFTIDATAPAAPVILTPADGSSTGDTTPELSGTAEPGATVEVRLDGVVVGTVVAEPDGSWTLTPTTPLTEGPHTVSATATDAAGNTSAATTNAFTVDLSAPAPPDITAPADGSVTGDSTPTILGTAEPGATVTVEVDGVSVGTVVADAKGQWFLETTTGLADGPHTVTATQTDPAGNTSAADSNTFAVDTTVAAPVIDLPANGTVTDDTTPMISGTGEPLATVTVTTSDGLVLGTALVGPDGSWTLNSVPLPDGTYTITATQVDLVGNASDESSAKIFTVDTAVDAPVVLAPADGSVTSDPTPVISGTAEPGALVQVTVDGVTLGTVEADPVTGAWSLPLTEPLADGDHTVVTVATDLAGNISDPSAAVTFTVDTVAPPVTITTPADGAILDSSPATASGTSEPGAEITVYVDGVLVGTTTADGAGDWTLSLIALADGLHVISAEATDAAGNTSEPTTNAFTVDTTNPAGPVITGPADGSTVGDATPTITGTAEPGATVTVEVDGVPVGTTTADPVTGAWSVQVTDPLTDGPHTVSATQTDLAGNDSAPTENGFTVDTTAASPTIDPSINEMVTDDSTPTIFGTGEPGATVTVTTSDGVVLGTALVDGTGSWTLDAIELVDGTYTITATQVDASGNTSPASSPAIFTVDTVVVPPVVTAPADGEVVATATPVITGTAEPGASVVVSVDGTVIGTVTADVNGDWTITSPPLNDGSHEVVAAQTDPAGNTSTTSDPVEFVVDTTAPAAPAIVSPADGSVTDDTTPVVSGTAEPGSTVEVSVDGTVIGTVPVQPDGSWELPLTAPLGDGVHTVTATATDAAGNSSPEASSTFTVDTTAPAPPIITGPADGSTIGDDTPTVTGTAEPGAVVVVTVGGESYETTADPVTGAWTVVVTEPLVDGEHTVSATATDEAGNVSAPATSTFTVDTTALAPTILGPESGDVTNDTTPTVNGTGEPGATVTVTIEGGTVIGTAVVGIDGTWSFDSVPLIEGVHTLVATQTDELGNVSPASSPVILTVDLTAVAPVITSPAAGDLVADTTPPISGTAEPGATVEVVIDGVPVGTTTADPDTGAWTFTPTTPLTQGEHTVAASQTDPAGNESPVSAPTTFVVDSVAPPAPVITGPADGSSTGDTTPTVTGTGEPGATVVVEIDDVVVGSVVVGTDGTWTVPVTTPLGGGEHTVSAVQTDAAGNTSPAGTSAFVVTSPTPPPPVVDAPPATGDTTPEISGAGTPGATVTVIIDGAPVGTAVVGADGTWSFQVTQALSCGSHQVTATQSVAGARPSAAATARTLRITCSDGTGLGGTGAPAGLPGYAVLGLLMVLAGAWLVRRRGVDGR